MKCNKNLLLEVNVDWRPRGVLICHLHEHSGSVNAVSISQDDTFFATCSDDGTVKIWDVKAIDKEIATCSRVTYAGQGGRVTSLTIVDNSHSVVSASDNGSLHVWRVDYGTSLIGGHSANSKATIGAVSGLTNICQIDVSQEVNYCFYVIPFLCFILTFHNYNRVE